VALMRQASDEVTLDDLCAETGLSLEQMLDTLRKSGRGIVFDTSRVPPDKHDSALAELEFRCTVEMLEESFRLAVCLHEAAHAEYSERVGAVFVEFIPPLAYLKNDCLEYVNARVSAYLEESEFEAERFTKIFISGDIVVAALIGSETGCNDPDSDNPDSDYQQLDDCFKKAKVRKQDRKKIIAQARTEILKDLRSPTFRNRLWKRAQFYKGILENTIYPQGVPS
jgi:hypothetical protein